MWESSTPAQERCHEAASSLTARGGFDVDVEWSGGKLTEATLRSRLGNRVRVRSADQVRDYDTTRGQRIVVRF
jgi:hypothetical protein